MTRLPDFMSASDRGLHDIVPGQGVSMEVAPLLRSIMGPKPEFPTAAPHLSKRQRDQLVNGVLSAFSASAEE